MFVQIFPTGTIRNTWKTVRRKYNYVKCPDVL